jgi:hypothetical protein
LIWGAQAARLHELFPKIDLASRQNQQASRLCSPEGGALPRGGL